MNPGAFQKWKLVFILLCLVAMGRIWFAWSPAPGSGDFPGTDPSTAVIAISSSGLARNWTGDRKVGQAIGDLKSGRHLDGLPGESIAGHLVIGNRKYAFLAAPLDAGGYRATLTDEEGACWEGAELGRLLCDRLTEK